jgi:MFS family permease
MAGPAVASDTRPRSLWRHRDFMLLWGGQTVSEVGSAVTTLALPLVALVTLDASTFAVGALTACTNLAFLVIALPAGAWVDRWRKKRVMIWGDVGRFLVLGSIPLAREFDALTLPHLFAAAILAGALTVFFDVAYQSYVPELLDARDLVDGNGKLGASQAFGQVAGPGFGGVLVAALGAAYAMAVDAASFAVSAVATICIRHREPPPVAPEGERSLRDEIREGLAFVLGHPVLRMVVACTATSNLFSGAQAAIVIVFMDRTLHASPGVIGLVLSLGSVGGVIGGAFAGRIAQRVGTARVIWLSIGVTGPFAVLGAFAFRGWGVALLAFAFFAFTAGGVVYNTAQVSYRQAICPRPLLGRMNASVRAIVWGALPLGGFAGAALGTWIGLRPTMFVTGIGGATAVLWLLASPLRHWRDIPATT